MVFGESLQFFSLLYSVPQFIENLRIHGFTKVCEKFVVQDDKPILLYDVNDVIRMSEGKKPEW